MSNRLNSRLVLRRRILSIESSGALTSRAYSVSFPNLSSTVTTQNLVADPRRFLAQSIDGSTGARNSLRYSTQTIRVRPSSYSRRDQGQANIGHVELVVEGGRQV